MNDATNDGHSNDGRLRWPIFAKGRKRCRQVTAHKTLRCGISRYASDALSPLPAYAAVLADAALDRLASNTLRAQKNAWSHMRAAVIMRCVPACAKHCPARTVSLACGFFRGPLCLLAHLRCSFSACFLVCAHPCSEHASYKAACGLGVSRVWALKVSALLVGGCSGCLPSPPRA